MNRQEKLKPLDIKVLSLFFIDRVDNFIADDGIIRLIFDQEFEDLKENTRALFRDLTADEVRSSYFAKKKVAAATGETEVALDTDGRNKEEREAEKAAFSLIMRDKERLLSFDEKQIIYLCPFRFEGGMGQP